MCSLPHHLHLQVCPSKPLAINSKVANPIAWPLRKQVTLHKQRNPFPWCFYSTTARLVKTWRIQTISQLCPIQNAKHLVPRALCFWLTWLKQQGWLCCANIAPEREKAGVKNLDFIVDFPEISDSEIETVVSAIWTDCLLLFFIVDSVRCSWKNSGSCKTILMTIVISISVPQLPSKRPSQV